MSLDPIKRKIAVLLTVSLLLGVLEWISMAYTPLEGPFFFAFFLLISLIFGYDTLLEGLRSLFHLRFSNINLLMSIAFMGAFYLGEYPEGAIVIILFTLAEALEDLGIKQSKTALENLIACLPKNAVLLNGSEVPIETLNPGDRIVIAPGLVFPIDGFVRQGISSVDESPITGEPFPKDKTEGDKVFAGSWNLKGVLEVEVLVKASESTLEKIREITLNALEKKAATQRFIETFSSYYTPFVILSAFFVLFVSTLYFGHSFDIGLKQSLVFLVISCPCALVVSTPIAIFSAIGNATKKGILIKGGKWLEALSKIKVLVLDKTKTLTKGRPKVSDVIPISKEETEESLIACAAGLEEHSNHPFAESLIFYAKETRVQPHSIKSFQQIIGKGIKADCLICGNTHHCIGKLQFVLEEHAVSESIVALIERLENEGKNVIVVCSSKEVKGIIAFIDEIRPESERFIARLKKIRVKPALLTGDRAGTATALAKQLEIEVLDAGALPLDKARRIQEQILHHTHVGMLGDGVNDAPALAVASVGLSFSRDASEIAKEASSIVVLSDNLNLIPELILLSRSAVRTIQFNTAFALISKGIVMGLAVFGFTNLPLAILADVGVTIVVILLSLRLFTWKSGYHL